MRPAAERAKRQVRLYGLQVNLRKQQPKMAEQQRGRFVPFVLAKGGDPQVLQEAPSASQIAAPSAPEQMPSAPEIAPSALAQRVTGEGEARAETGPELDARMAQQAANRNERTPYRPSEMAQRSAAHTRSLQERRQAIERRAQAAGKVLTQSPWRRFPTAPDSTRRRESSQAKRLLSEQ